MPSKKSGADIWPILKRFIPLLLVYWPKFLLIFVLILFVTGFELVRPKLIGLIVDEAASRQSWSHVLILLGLFLLSVVGRSVVLLTRNFLIQRTGMRVTCDMRINLFRHLQNLSLRFYDALAEAFHFGVLGSEGPD